ncbi:hypothetical protein [Thalassotalea maritima]|uniref:hypothetical protein n=1 Tax=Thalassotalea maritima TaxID=3242416 RepID=UPI0035281193
MVKTRNITDVTFNQNKQLTSFILFLGQTGTALITIGWPIITKQIKHNNRLEQEVLNLLLSQKRTSKISMFTAIISDKALNLNVRHVDQTDSNYILNSIRYRGFAASSIPLVRANIFITVANFFSRCLDLIDMLSVIKNIKTMHLKTSINLIFKLDGYERCGLTKHKTYKNSDLSHYINMV